MAFRNISNIRTAPVESALYFIDANAWIYSLQNFDSLEWWAKIYSEFFYDIVESALAEQPKIVLSSLLLSEIINTFLRKIAIPEYKLITGIPASNVIDFKRDYRSTLHFRDSFERIMDDISGLRSSIKFIDDSDIVNEATLLGKKTGNFDFNDYLYYRQCQELNKRQKVIIVTNDSDFQINDIEIVTLNRTLLSLI